MADSSRSRRSPTRFLAPLALIVVIAGVYLVIQHDEKKTTSHPRSAVSHAPAKTEPGHAKARHRGRAAAKVYVVKPGDSLSTISARTGVSLPKLQELNPGVSASSLQVGQHLKLQR